jgi:hypothetical protein
VSWPIAVHVEYGQRIEFRHCFKTLEPVCQDQRHQTGYSGMPGSDHELSRPNELTHSVDFMRSVRGAANNQNTLTPRRKKAGTTCSRPVAFQNKVTEFLAWFFAALLERSPF